MNYRATDKSSLSRQDKTNRCGQLLSYPGSIQLCAFLCQYSSPSYKISGNKSLVCHDLILDLFMISCSFLLILMYMSAFHLTCGRTGLTHTEARGLLSSRGILSRHRNVHIPFSLATSVLYIVLPRVARHTVLKRSSRIFDPSSAAKFNTAFNVHISQSHQPCSAGELLSHLNNSCSTISKTTNQVTSRCCGFMIILVAFDENTASWNIKSDPSVRNTWVSLENF